MRSLVVEDDFTARKLMQRMLLGYGDCDVAVDGKEALEAFGQARGEGASYDLICLDIMMPRMNGHEVLEQIRAQEASHGILGKDGVKVVMTTALADSGNILRAFDEQCEAYLVKPVKRVPLTERLQEFGLVGETSE